MANGWVSDGKALPFFRSLPMDGTPFDLDLGKDEQQGLVKDVRLPWFDAESGEDFNGAMPLLKHDNNVPTEYEKRCTSLHLAAGDEHSKIVQHLLERGANINERDQRMRTPLHLAADS
jgi:Ankyrin repeats (many copies)